MRPRGQRWLPGFEGSDASFGHLGWQLGRHPAGAGETPVSGAWLLFFALSLKRSGDSAARRYSRVSIPVRQHLGLMSAESVEELRAEWMCRREERELRVIAHQQALEQENDKKIELIQQRYFSGSQGPDREPI